MAHPGGRPSTYTPELATQVCEMIATQDMGLKRLAATYDWFPDHSTIYLWLVKHEQFSTQYYKAREQQAQVFAESTIDIADEKPYFTDSDGNERIDAGYVQWQKMNVNVRQWHASKLAPKRWGDKKEIEQLQGENDRVKAELAELRAKLDKANVSEY